MKVIVVIDAFRAFATACYVLKHQPKRYAIANNCTVISRLALDLSDPFLIGKPEKGSALNYDIPNSPTRVQDVLSEGRYVLHRTEAGAKGILQCTNADIILAAAFVNAEATVQFLLTLTKPNISIVPMGHEGNSPTLEDDVCAMYIEALLSDKKINLGSYLPELRKGPGRYFFSDDQWQYPQEDFNICLQTDSFNFAIHAEVRDDYAILRCCK